MPASTRVVAVGWAPSLRSCFVNLPPSWCAPLLASRRAPSEYAVCIEWTEGEVARQRKAYVSWAGGASAPPGGNFSAVNPFDRGKDAVAGTIEFDPLFGNTLGLRPGQNVTVELLNASKDATVVEVEPLSPDDWEILELHADFIENQLLNQVRILAVHQPVTVWIHKTTINLRVAKTEPADDFVRLNPDCEVVVAPKKRIWDDSQNNLKTSLKPPLLCLRVMPIELVRPVDATALTADQELSVLANPSDLPLRYAAGQVVRIRKAHHAQAIERKRLRETENTELGNAQEGASALHAVVEPDDSIPRGHLAMPQLLSRQLEIEWFDRAFLEGVSGSPAEASSITLLHGNSRAHGDHICQCFRDWLSRSKGPLVLTDGMLLCFGRRPDDDGEEAVRLRLTHQDPHSDQSEMTPAVPSVIVETPTALAKVPLAAVNGEPVQLKSYGEQYPVTLLGGIDETLQNAIQYVDTRLGHPALSRTISAPAAGGTLVLGESGSGKTAFTQQVSSSLARELGVLSYVQRINCAKLAEERIPVVKIKIREALEDAAWREPAIVLLDDIDKLMPSEVENVDSSRTRLLSETLIDWTWPILQRRRVTIMASAKNQQSLHQSLIESHLFSHVLHLGSPDKKGRNEILRAINQSLPVGSEAQVSFSSVDFATVASRTEGYLPADLRTLTERAVQECALRIAWEDESADLGSFMEVTTADFDKAQEGFVPVSLRDVNLEKSEVRWSDVGGMAAAKQVLLETLELPTKFAAIFAGCPLRLRSGLLLYGYPGCGKTMLASAVAWECGLNFISVKGPELLNKYIGASEKSVRDLFERAQAAKPCVLFFDEFDSLAPRRGHDNTGVTDRVVNQLLTQIDGAERVDGVYVVAATSRPDLIDPALLRPGRLDKSIFCDMPSREERLQILTAQTKRLNFAEDVDLSEFAELCHGFSGADLQSLLSNAHLEAIHAVIKAPEDVSEKAEQLLKREEERDYFVISGRTDKRMTRAEGGRVAERLARICSSGVRRGDPDSKPKTRDTEFERPQIILSQDHLRRAFASMRPSLPSDEHARFQRIYRTYANERSGKVRGGLEVNATGKRASLV